MYLTGHKKIITAFLLIAFIGQSITALAMSCRLETHLSSSHTMMAGMDHSMMSMDDSMNMMNNHEMPVSGDQKADCCKTMGDCSFNNCSLIGITNSVSISLKTLASAAIDSFASVQPLLLVSSLYRPPIFR
jgi:hypothetical protein